VTQDEMCDRLLEFASNVIEFTEKLPDTKAGRHVAGQLLRSGTSPGPNYEEACAAESKADFIHRLRIVLKELRESHWWLRLAAKRRMFPDTVTRPLISEAKQLCSIVGKSIATATSRSKQHDQ